MHRPKNLLTLLLAFLPVSLVSAQSVAVVVEAESGVRGAELTTGTNGSVQYVTASTDLINAGNPGSTARMLTLQVTLPAAGTYELYGRVRVGAGAGSDDSFFYATGFGTKSATGDGDWITVNQLAGFGYTASTDVVAAGGNAPNGAWRWIKLSAFASDEAGVKFTVTADALTQTFQVGARENGLDFDKFAFGGNGVFYTVANLDNQTAGSVTDPGSPGTPDPYTPTGSALAIGKTKWVGSAHSLPNQNLYFERYWNQVVPENGGKWGSVEGTRDIMNWTAADAAYNLAKAANLPFRYHVLIWGNQQPAWIESLSAAEQLEEIDEWFAAVAARYPDLDILEVVNEPLHDPPDGPGDGNYINALGGSGATGWDWVLNAFRRARVQFPKARLMLNDYSITNSASSTNSYLNIINLLKAEKLIDVIGIQCHAFEHSSFLSVSALKANLDTLAATGLPIYVTELDFDGLTDQVQLEYYQRYFPVYYEHPGVYGVTLWGWRPGHWRSAQQAYIVLENGAERPAMRWLKEYLNSAPIVATQNFIIAEGSGAGTVVGTVQAHDWEGATLGTWAITGGGSANLFTINATTGQITVAPGATPATGTHLLELTVRDQYTVSAAGTVRVNVSNQPQKVTGGAYEFAADISHANGNIYDQILITGANTTFRADAGQIVRASYIDLSNDIVQIEYTGPGTVAVTLSGMTPPALPLNYNQSVAYVKGHATITIEGATELSHLSVFSVGTLTASNPALWKNVAYDGVADLAAVNIASPTNRFGGLRASNASFWATSGSTGVNAPGVNFDLVNFHDISAQADATPLLLTGTIGSRAIAGTAYDNTILITGGDLAQANGRAVQFGAAARLYMGAGTTSHNGAQAAKTNQATFTRNGSAFTPIILP